MKKVSEQYVLRPIKWIQTKDAAFPFQTTLNKNELKIAVNELPDKPLYSLFVDGKKVSDFNRWPIMWRKYPLDYIDNVR